MPTVIDSLVITLGLDPRNFNQQQKDAIKHLRDFENEATRAGKNVEAQGKKTQEFFAGLKREATVLLGTFLGGKGIKEFVSYITSADAATNRLSKTVGMSTRDLSAWQGAIQQIGGSAESATGGIVGMNDAVQQFLLTGELPALRVFNQLGVSLFNAKGQVKDAGEMWLAIADAIKGVDPVRATALLKLLPGANQDMINFALMGRPIMERYLEVQRQIGVATAESGVAAEDYQRALSQLTTSAERLGQSLLTTVTPALVGIMNIFENLLGFGKAKGIGLTHGPGLLWAQLFGTPEDLQERRDAFHEADRMARESLDKRVSAKKKLDDLIEEKRGLDVKPGSGSSSPATRRMMDALSGMPGLNRVTALNDAFHGGAGAHGAGNAMDVSISGQASMQFMLGAIRARLAEAGISANVEDHSNRPGSTGPHIHISAIPSLGGFTPGAAAAAGAVTNSRSSVANSNSANTNIGTIVINDASGDPDRVASGISGALRRQSLTAPANFGQQ